MAYSALNYINPTWNRIDAIETRLCEQMIHCAETGSEALSEHNEELSDAMMDRHHELELRLERVAGIAAKLSAKTLGVGTERHRKFIADKSTPMNVGELKMLLDQISDDSTPVYLESGEPVRYTCSGVSQNETRLFIGVM
jgi:hypothetical protein